MDGRYRLKNLFFMIKIYQLKLLEHEYAKNASQLVLLICKNYNISNFDKLQLQQINEMRGRPIKTLIIRKWGNRIWTTFFTFLINEMFLR